MSEMLEHVDFPRQCLPMHYFFLQMTENNY